MKILEKAYNSFLTFFGDIKVFKFPLFLVYDPGSYRVKGEEIRQVIESIRPGDILVRGYVNYLDGYFIPGLFSHAGLYLGEVTEPDQRLVSESETEHFRTGKQMVIHSMAEGVFMEDVLNFCRCDFMMILRRNTDTESDAAKAWDFVRVKETALKNLGKGYDFKFDFSDFSKFSCTEFVYASCLGFMDEYNIKVRTERVLFMKRRMIAPDDFVRSDLTMVWRSDSVTDRILKKIQARKQA
jgi:hypothetical protein